jgi:hypothetical protein
MGLPLPEHLALSGRPDAAFPVNGRSSTPTSHNLDSTKFVLIIGPVLCAIHPSSWNRYSANFAFWGFSEVRIHGVLRSSHSKMMPQASIMTPLQAKPLGPARCGFLGPD